MKLGLLILFCIFHHLYCEEFMVDLKEYLDIKNDAVVKELQPTKPESVLDYDKYVLKIVKYSNDIILDHSGARGHAKIFNLVGASFVLLNENLYNVSTRNCCKSVYKFSKIVKEIKATEMGDLGLILTIGKYGNVYIHGARNQKVFSIQNIQLANVSDAVFFKQNDKLYLIVSTLSNNEGDSYTFTTLYKFTNTHFDEIDRMLTVGARKIATFHENGSEIIAIFQHCVNREVTSALYEFRSGYLRKIQKFEAPNPGQVLTYTYNRRKYIMALDNSSITLYWWTGSELFWNVIFTNVNLGKTTNFYSTGGTPLLISSKNNTIISFKLLENEVDLIINSEFQTNFSKILDVMQIDHDRMAVMGLENNSISIYTLQLNLDVQKVDQSENSDGLRSCLLALEKSAYVFRAKLNKILNPRHDILYANERNSTVGAAEAHKINRKTSFNTPHDHYKTMRKYHEGLVKRFKRMRSTLDTYSVNPNDLVINGTTVLQSVTGDKAEAKDMHLKSLNSRKWNDKGWLSYSLPQRITGKVTAKQVSVKNLETPWTHTLFQNLVLNSHQVMVSTINASNVKANDIITDSMNGIKLESLLIDHGHSFVFVQGLKRFVDLTVQSARVNNMNDVKKASDIALLISNPGVLKYSFANNLPIENLWIETINGVNWKEFEDSVFVIGETRSITGNLIFATLEVEHARFRTLNNVLVDQLFTTSTNQTIDNFVTIRNMFANTIIAKAVNDVDLVKSVATFGNNTLIKGPVKVDHILVRNNLNDKLSDSSVKKDKVDKHIIGTSANDLRQIYNGKVKIRGDLYVRNLKLSENVKLTVDEKAFDFESEEKYWTKNTPQIILTHFEAQNGMSAPKLISKSLNAVKIDDYLMINTEAKNPSKFYFENVSVKGDIKLNQNETHSPDLKKIERNSVKRYQNNVVSGHKTYKSLLKIDKLEANVVDKINISAHVLMSTMSPSTKSFRHVLINGSLSVSNLSMIKTLNDVNIPQLMSDTVFIDQDRNITKLNFDTITVERLRVSRVNDVEMNPEQMKKLDRINTLREIETVRINGNVTIRKARNLGKINGIDVNSTMDYNNFMFKNDTVYGNVTFKNAINAKNLIMSWVNDINLPKLSLSLLHNKWNQNVKAPFTFRNIKTRNLLTAKINDICVQNLMDIKNETLQMIIPKSNIRISNSMIKKRLSAEVNCDLRLAINRFRDPLPQNWGHVDITGNVTLWDGTAALKRLFNNVVTTTTSNVISGTVNFTNHISANNVNSVGKINDVLLSSIQEDALLKDYPLEQAVTGNIIFNELSVDSAVILGNTVSSTIDSIDVTKVLGKLPMNPSDVTIKGKKVFFQGLQSKNFFAKSIGNVETNNIVTDKTSTRMIPHAVFDVIRARDLELDAVNGTKFHQFLEDRLLCNSNQVQFTDATYIFDNQVFVHGHATANSINGIDVKNVIFDVGVQSVDHLKRFVNDVTVSGDVNVEYVNGMKISDYFRNAILTNNTSQFTGVTKIMRPSVVNGNITADSINGIPFDTMLTTMRTEAIKVEAGKIHEIEHKVAEFIKKYYDATLKMDTEFMYLEEATDLQVTIPNTVNAQVVQFDDDVLIHIEAEDSDIDCGLDRLCKCPVQYTMQISSEHSINMFPNKGSQRIYTYHDNGIVAHVMSNSISTSASCRTSSTKIINELSSINWNTIPEPNKISGFFMHPKTIAGYVSAVEFFTLHRKSYIVIGRYYDPQENSHNISTVVYKFSDDKTKLMEIQNIPSIGTWTLLLFETTQGVVLIMGSSEEFEHVRTKIFLFNPMNDQFQLLRTVAPASSAVGVVLEFDSLILLADHAKLNVLKYNQLYKNYYFYQSIQMDYPITKMSVFYTGDIGTSDPYLTVVMDNDKYSMFSFHFLEGWKLESSGELDGIKGLIPFKLNHTQYLFAPSAKLSRVLKVVQHDSN